jgi:hypothetical protein
MTPAPVDIRGLSPALLPDFLSFFDAEAFADNPRWAFCYCQFAYVDHDQVDWKARTAEVNRAAACERIGTERMQGYLAAEFNVHRTLGDGRVAVRRSLR